MREDPALARETAPAPTPDGAEAGRASGPAGRVRITSFLQPIVSVRQRAVRLVEALARGFDADNNVVLPRALFEEATRLDRRTELEERCRAAALEAYRIARKPGFEPVLSLNTDSSLVLAGARGAERLVAEVQAASVTPSSVALEILESRFRDSAELEHFCRAARAAGFLLALDDVGTGHSNLERIPRLEPDILKLDRKLVHGVSTNYHQREVFRALLALSHKIGAEVIAEGIEVEEDVLTALSLGCDLFQGYYFGYPADPATTPPVCDATRLHHVGQKLKQNATRRLNERRAHQRHSERALWVLVDEMTTMRETDFENALHRALERQPFIEALYILDEQGVQITHTVHRSSIRNRRREALFQPAARGADQSLKHYFMMLDAGLEKYTSDPYISSASGNYCITMSRYFDNALGLRYVLCCDIIVDAS
jgi:EAL domain-containing protein (putative c-di-GMP-specific phosphodiesterase class I)